MKYLSYAVPVFIVILIFGGCSKTEEPALQEAYFSGKITVDPELDDSQDYSGIELLAALQDTQGNPVDTIYHAITDTSGFFEGTARFETRQIYPVFISRYGNSLGVVNMIFADGDSVYMESQLPHAERTTSISSAENDAYQTFERLQRNFNRVALFINTGEMEPENIEEELQKWSDLYWDLYKQKQGTLASRNSASSSLTLLYGWNNELFEQRLNELIDDNPEIPSDVRRLAVRYHTAENGIEGAEQFFEKLSDLVDSPQYRMSITMDKIELYFDSVRINRAEELLTQFKLDYSDNERAIEWANNVEYDLKVLSPGQPFPQFEFETTDGSLITSGELSNTPFLLEFTRFDDLLYQEQYERTTAIYQIYNMFGLRIVTVPLSTSRVALEAFFEEHPKLWDVVEPDSFDQDEILDRYNVNRIPTRFLVNERGEIIQRYIGTQYDDIVRGLQQILTEQEAE